VAVGDQMRLRAEATSGTAQRMVLWLRYLRCRRTP
jgi:hypothetical protein